MNDVTNDAVARATFEATILRLDSADMTTRLLLDNHIAEYRREFGDLKGDVKAINTKLDTVITNQERWKGRDGVILVIIGIVASVLTAIITASLLGAM